MRRNYALILLAAVLILAACKRKEIPTVNDPIMGCTDPDALNYDSTATEDNGSCAYPDEYLPMTAGNMWTLEDEITIPLVGSVSVTAVFRMMKDTTINGVDYVISEESVGVPGFFEQEERYAYRSDKEGKVYRADLNAETFEEILFIDYPPVVGNNWQGGDQITGQFKSIDGSLTVPAGSFTDVIAVDYTDIASGQVSTMHWGADGGPLKFEISMEVQFVGNIGVEAELTSYTIN